MKESPTTVTKKQGWGGKRADSGRKPGPYAGTSKVTTILLTTALIEKLHKLGGSSWVREQIIKSKDDLLPGRKARISCISYLYRFLFQFHRRGPAVRLFSPKS